MTSETIPVDIQTITRKADKIFNLLKRRSKNPQEAYIIVKFLTYFFEYDIGVKMLKTDEEMLIKIIKENKE